jgi:hypothetical protein
VRPQVKFVRSASVMGLLCLNTKFRHATGPSTRSSISGMNVLRMTARQISKSG